MTPERWRQIEEVFGDAVELAVVERAAFLDRACDHDGALRREIEVLLASVDGAADSLHDTVARGATLLQQAAVDSHVGSRIGPYRLTAVIGEGGMGTVYRAARDDAEYVRDVAIKILRPIAASPLLVARLRDERQLLAALDHRGIVRLLDGGTTDEGLPYIVMELIDGVPLTTYARALPVRDRVRLVLEIAAALQYAHQKLIVHRDVKPSNILVDANGEPRLLDFGIAKLLDDATDRREAHTRTGMAVFTIEYASPEQVRGEPVSVATDVYSLGAVLYELLGGRPPQRRGATVIESLANVCDLEPPRPSSIASGAVARELVGDLDNIVLKALQKAPALRYPSANAFADDLERYLDGRPVRARDATLGYRARKLVARHRGKVTLGVLVASALTAATVISLAQAARADRQAAQAERDKRSLLRERGLQELAIGRASRALPYFAEVLREGDDSAALRLVIADAMRPLSRERAKVPVDAGETGIAWPPDGARFAVTQMSGRAAIYDAAGARVVALDSHAPALGDPVFSHDGTLVAAAGSDGHVVAWDAATGALRFDYTGHGRGANGLAFTADDHALLVPTDDGWIVVLDSRTGAALASRQLAGPDVTMTAFALGPDDRHVACGTNAGALYQWEFAADREPTRLAGHAATVYMLRYSPDGSTLFSSSEDHTVQTWDAATGAHRATVVATDRAITAIDLDRDATHLATAARDGTAAVWDVSTGKLAFAVSGSQYNGVNAIRFSPDGAHLVATAGDGTFRLWDRRGNPEVVFEGSPGAGDAGHAWAASAHDAKFSPDGSLLLAATNREVRVYRTDRTPLVSETAMTDGAFAVAWSPDGARLAIAGSRFAGIWEVATMHETSAIAVGPTRVWDLAWSPDGRQLAMAGDDGAVSVRDARGGLVRAFAGHHGIVNRVTWSPDGTRILTAASDHTARIWDAATGAPLRALAHDDGVLSATWRHDGAQIVTACWDRKIRIWDAANGTLVSTIDSGGMQLLDATFSPDDRSLAASAHGGDVKIWNLETGARPLALEGHTDAVSTAAWSPDGGLVATAGYDGTMRLWDPSTGEQLAMRPSGTAMSLAWNPAGTQIVVVGEDAFVRVWDVHRATEPTAEILDYIAQHVAFGLDGAGLERRVTAP